MAEEKEAHMPSGEYGRAGVAGGAKAQGHHLARHLHSLHGEDFLKQFHDGMMSGMGSGGSNTGQYEGEGKMRGGFWGVLASLALPLVSKLLGQGKMSKEAHDEMKEMMEEHERKYHSGKKLKGGFWGALASIGIPLLANLLGKGKMSQEAHDELCEMMRSKGRSQKMKGSGRVVGGMMMIKPIKDTVYPAPAYTREDIHPTRPRHPPKEELQMEGKGFLSDLGIPLVSDVAGMLGLGKKKRVVSENDGRRKRAEVVRKVMKEKGMKMIEASKYVKQHGLY
jgi:hypothetical protein